MSANDRLDAIEQRLDRLERLAFIAFTDVREVAEYSYQSVLTETEDVRRASFRQPNFHPLSDREALEIAGLAAHELAALKMTVRVLRKQTRHDVLGIVRDLVRRGKKASLKERSAA